MEGDDGGDDDDDDDDDMMVCPVQVLLEEMKIHAWSISYIGATATL